VKKSEPGFLAMLSFPITAGLSDDSHLEKMSF